MPIEQQLFPGVSAEKSRTYHKLNMNSMSRYDVNWLNQRSTDQVDEFLPSMNSSNLMTNEMKTSRASQLEQQKSSSKVADDKVGPDRWISRTIRIGQELEHPNLKKRLKQKKLIQTIEDEQLANPENNQSLLKNVLHKGYWKYKPEHFKELQQKISQSKKKFS